MRMLLYLGMLAIGILIGYKEMAHPKLLSRLSHFQMAALLLLLFIMGMRIGGDKEVMNSIQIIGFRAFVFALLTIVFSVFLVYLYEKFTHKGELRK